MRILATILVSATCGLVACQPEPDIHQQRLRLLTATQQQVNENMASATKSAVEGIAAQVESGHNMARDIAALRQAEAMLSNMNSVIGRLRHIRAALLQQGYNRRQVSEAASREMVKEVLFRPTSTSVDSLYQHIRGFSEYMAARTTPEQIQAFWYPTAPSTQLPAVRTLMPALADYRRVYFDQASVTEALAVLAHQETLVLTLGNAGLSALYQKVSSGWDGFHAIKAAAVAESKTVKPGEKYVASLFMLHNRYRRAMRMTVNGNPIPVDAEGYGRVELIAPAQLPAGKNSVHLFWDGTINYLTYGHDTTFHIRVYYTVRK